MATNYDGTMDTTSPDGADLAANKGKLVSDLKVVLADAQDLLRSASNSTGEKAMELREKAAASLKVASEKLVDLQAAAVERSKAAARVTDDYVHDNPWKAIAAAAVIGFLLGLAANRS